MLMTGIGMWHVYLLGSGQGREVVMGWGKAAWQPVVEVSFVSAAG
jgi:hypothetical protein